MNWSFRRKLLYALSFFLVATAIGVYSLRESFFPKPTCVDQKKNGFETGVDCGGECALWCPQEVSSLSVLWAKVIPSGKGLYDLVALVNNNNINNASAVTGYTFHLFNKDAQEYITFSGSTTAPLGGKFPIILQSIPLTEYPASVQLKLTDTEHYSVKENPASPTIKILSRRYESGNIPRVYTTIANTKRVEIRNLPVSVLLFDDKENVYAVGTTIIPMLQKEEVKEVVFTWNEQLQHTPARIFVYPIFNPFEAIGY